jgi:hypothetical protein
MNRSTIAKTFAIAAVSALALSIAPAAKADDSKGCSNASVKGTFGFKGTGFFVMPTSIAGPIATVSTLTFDGIGAVTSAVGSSSQNGNIGPQTETGTYTVNPDCTGTYMVVITPGGFTAHYFFVVDAGTYEIQIICTDSGVVFSGTARRQFPVGDFRQ